MKAIKIGIEMEYPICNEETGEPVTVPEMPYEKDKPLFVNTPWGQCAIHKDGASVECAMPPCNNNDDLVACEAWARQYITDNLPDGVCIAPLQAAYEYSDEQLARDPSASDMGCSPSMNIYAGRSTTPDSYASNWRFSGMHLNVSFDLDDGAELEDVVLAMDAVIASSVAVTLTPDEASIEAIRRQYYGQYGEYRSRKWGVEYRTLSVAAFDKISNRVFDLVNCALSRDIDKLMQNGAHQLLSQNTNCVDDYSGDEYEIQ